MNVGTVERRGLHSHKVPRREILCTTPLMKAKLGALLSSEKNSCCSVVPAKQAQIIRVWANLWGWECIAVSCLL
jgi:hypothetical protein